MRILTRYVLREFVVPLVYCLTGFLSIYVLFELFGSFSRMAEAKPPFGKIVSYIAGYVAPYFEWLAPACLMLATLYTMWRFCRHSELIAMRASGIGFFAIVKPLLAVAALMAAFTAWVNECYVPRRAQWAKQFRDARFKEDEMTHADDLVYHNAKADRTWNVGAVMNDTATALENVKVVEDWPGGARKTTVLADRAEYLDGQWFFLNPKAYYYDRAGAETASPVPQLDSLTLRSFPGFSERPSDFLLVNKDRAFYSISDRLRYLETHPSLAPDSVRSYRYDIWAKVFSPLACLVITLFAIPAGIATGRQSVFRGIVTALCMFFAFYGITIGFMILAKKGLCPPLVAAALPDVAFFFIGLRMFWRQR